MVRLAEIDPGMRAFLTHYKCPPINTNAWSPGPALNKRRVALISWPGSAAVMTVPSRSVPSTIEYCHWINVRKSFKTTRMPRTIEPVTCKT